MPAYNRKGSQIVEATMVLPVTILIVMALIGIVLTFYTGLQEQIESHRQEREELYTGKEITVLRLQQNIPVPEGTVAVE